MIIRIRLPILRIGNRFYAMPVAVFYILIFGGLFVAVVEWLNG